MPLEGAQCGLFLRCLGLGGEAALDSVAECGMFPEAELNAICIYILYYMYMIYDIEIYDTYAAICCVLLLNDILAILECWIKFRYTISERNAHINI